MNLHGYFFKFVLIFILTASSFSLRAQMPDFYSEAASTSKRAGHSEAPNEIIDPFSGTLNIVHNDVVIPGNGGLDILVQRVYSSNNVYRKVGTASSLSWLQARQPVGQGWLMHFGRIRMAQFSNPCATYNLDDTTNNPILEMQDGSQKMLFCNDYASTYGTNAEFVTKDNGVVDYINPAQKLNGLIYIDPNGIKYTMEFLVFGGTGGTKTDNVWYTTRIEDRNGNYLTISYDSDSDRETVLPTKIVSNDGRTVTFTYTSANDPTKARLASIKYGSQTWTYTYDYVGDYLHQSTTDYYYLLKKVDLPGTNTGDWNYTYYNRSYGDAGDRILSKITYPYGATTTYDYEYHCFMYSSCSSSSQYSSLVVKSKVNAGRSITPGTWSFFYGESGIYDFTTISGPTSKEIYKHYGLHNLVSHTFANHPYIASNNDSLWRVGLLLEKKILTTAGVTLQTEQYDYLARAISAEYYSRFPYNTVNKRISDPNVYAPYLTEKRIIRDGKTYTTKYENFTDNINPHKITEIGQSTRVKTLDYYPRIDGQNIVSQVDDEQYSSNTNRRIIRTFDGDGNLKTENRYGVLTTYNYYSNGNLSSVKDARNKTTSYSNYYRGIARTETHPENISITRTVDTYGNVTSVNNGRGHTTSYDYDLRNRLDEIDYPTGSTSHISWSSNARTLTRGAYSQVIIFDGFGRPICTITENIYVGEAYNAVGNRTYETYPNNSSCASTSRTSFTYDALNRLKRSTHTDGSYTELTYQTNNKQRLRDERGNFFYNSYRSYSNPDEQGLISVTGPESLSVSIGRNDLGQVTSINRNGVVRTYNYGSTIFLQSETNPETGTTTYGRDAVGNMTSKKVGSSSTTTYTYDDINRLEFTNYPTVTPDIAVTYDGNSNIKTINSGIANITYTYNANNNLTKEQQNIDGKNYFLNYSYTALDYLNTITYPDGGVVSYSPNDLGWPTKAAPYVTNIDYDSFGRPTLFTYANGRTQSQSYWARGWPRRTIVNGSISDRERTYDAAGNMTVVNDRLKNLYDLNMTYDGLNRLKTSNGAWGNGTITYSTDDDITKKTMGTNSLTYSYSNSNNRITSVSGIQNFVLPAQYTYDNYGNVTQKARGSIGWTYSYDDASNLRKVYSAGGTQLRSYDYSGQKQRVRSVKSGETRIHIISKTGQLMSEVITNGVKPNTTNVYVGNRLVAELEEQVQPRPDATVFGWGHGYSENKYSYTTNFLLSKLGRTKICIDGYSINSTTEVSVKLNGTLLGYMNTGTGPKETCFTVSESQLVVGNNTLEFTQTSPIQLWGVSAPSIGLTGPRVVPAISVLLLDDEEE